MDKSERSRVKQVLADDKLARVGNRILGLQAIGYLGIVMKAHEVGIITRSEGANTV